MSKGDIYDNEGERLQILSADAFEVRYRKKHWRPKKDDKEQHIAGREPYYHTYVIGADRAQLHVENKFWNKTEPKTNNE
ncbi:hypothetical protein A6C57_01285 [Fibrella sp. ES10-3-2-2]|nr:hypothetical protein A6C57_01285 [Fibrella sp. ES10-3-2-2]